MNAIEKIFQLSATILTKIFRALGLRIITQFRIVLSIIAITQSFMVLIGLYLFTAVSVYFPNYDETLFIYIFVYTLIIIMYTTKQWKTVFEGQSIILEYLDNEEPSLEEKLNSLKKSRESYTFALASLVMFGVISWFVLQKNTELVMLIVIPAFLDVLANGFATAWEISTISEPISKPATDT